MRNTPLPRRNGSRPFLLAVPGVLSALLIFDALPALAVRNPSLCTDPSVAIQIREFFDQNDDGIPDTGIPLTPNTAKEAGDIVLYQAGLSHGGADKCGYEKGILCIDLPRIGCPAANPAVAVPSYTTVAPGECCDATVRTGAVPLVCDPNTCVPPGVAEHASDYIRYVVDPVDTANHGRCRAGELRANAYYDEGISHQAPVDVVPATASIPICNQTAGVVGTHFMCYEMEKVHASPALRISLFDRFRTISNIKVDALKRLCNPADKNDEDPNQPPFPNDVDHLAFYEINTPTFTPRRVQVSNQFGTQTIDMVRAVRLMVPTSKGPINPVAQPAGAPNPPTLDHYQCYVAQGTGVGRVVTVEDQFGTLDPVEVRRPDWACVPVKKNTEPWVNPDEELGPGFVCYDVRADRQDYIGTVHIANQFNVTPLGGDIDVHGPRELCVQSTFTVLQ